MVAHTRERREKLVAYDSRTRPDTPHVMGRQCDSRTVFTQCVNRCDGGIWSGNRYDRLVKISAAVGISYCICYEMITGIGHCRVKNIAGYPGPGPDSSRITCLKNHNRIGGAENSSHKNGGIRNGKNSDNRFINIATPVGIDNFIPDGVVAGPGNGWIESISGNAFTCPSPSRIMGGEAYRRRVRTHGINRCYGRIRVWHDKDDCRCNDGWMIAVDTVTRPSGNSRIIIGITVIPVPEGHFKILPDKLVTVHENYIRPYPRSRHRTGQGDDVIRIREGP